MRCFFHLVGEEDELLDGEGVEVSSLDQARAEAMQAVAELRRDRPEIEHEWSGWRLDIVDDAGRRISSVELGLPFGG